MIPLSGPGRRNVCTCALTGTSIAGTASLASTVTKRALEALGTSSASAMGFAVTASMVRAGASATGQRACVCGSGVFRTQG